MKDESDERFLLDGFVPFGEFGVDEGFVQPQRVIDVHRQTVDHILHKLPLGLGQSRFGFILSLFRLGPYK